jgi:DNA-binding NarL/FixJ family response regulator
MPQRQVKVLIADDHPLIRLGIRNLFDRSPDITVVDEAVNGLEALELIEKLDPDVLLLDLMMPILDGFEVLERLQASNARVRVILVSTLFENQFSENLTNLGAFAYIQKDEAPQKIVEAVRKAVAHIPLAAHT